MKKAVKASKAVTDLSAEHRAYLNQQINEFEPYFMPDSDIGVEVHKDEKSGEFHVQLVLSGGGTYVKSEAKHVDFYQATLAAKIDLLTHLQKIEAWVLDNLDRDSVITEMMKNSPYIH
jgi:ribosome-associated translation inhibitor RaiA